MPTTRRVVGSGPPSARIPASPPGRSPHGAIVSLSPWPRHPASRNLRAVTDRRILYTSAFLRALATGMVGVIAGLYLARLGFSPAASGLVIGGGLAGAALATLLAALRADRIGRRRFL